nr:protein SET domain group 40 [Tanacetum cinerariifolium]
MDEEATAKFLKWATTLGISDSSTSITHSHSCLGHSLSISYFPNSGGRGLCAVRDVDKGELILKVPKSALMTSQSLMSNDHTLSLSLSKISLSSTQILTVALLNEVAKGKRSWWYPYLTQFPTNYDVLASFDEVEIQALQLDDAIWAAEKALEKAKMEWESAKTVMEELMFKPHYMSFKAGCGHLHLYLPAQCIFLGMLLVVFVLSVTFSITLHLTKSKFSLKIQQMLTWVQRHLG